MFLHMSQAYLSCAVFPLVVTLGFMAACMCGMQLCDSFDCRKEQLRREVLYSVLIVEDPPIKRM